MTGTANDVMAMAAAAYNAGDYEKAIELYMKAADEGDPEALVSLGNIYLECGEEQNGLACFKKAAAIGSADAVFNLGLIYYQGLKTVPHDFEKAAVYLQFLIDHGIKDAEAIHLLGRCYALKPERDIDKALELFTEAAEMGNEKAAKDRDAVLLGGQIIAEVS